VNDETTALIALAPQDTGLAPNHSEFQMRLFSERRDARKNGVRKNGVTEKTRKNGKKWCHGKNGVIKNGVRKMVSGLEF